MTIAWPVEKYVEDALVKYLRARMPGECAVYPSLYPMDGITFPYIGIAWTLSRNVDEGGQFTGHRSVSVSISLVMEAAHITDTTGQQLESVREINRRLEHDLWTALSYDDLHTQINAEVGWSAVGDVWSGGSLPVYLSEAVPGDATPGVEGREISTTIEMEIIAHAREM